MPRTEFPGGGGGGGGGGGYTKRYSVIKSSSLFQKPQWKNISEITSGKTRQ